MKTEIEMGDIIFATYNVTNKLLVFVYINAKINNADELLKHRLLICNQFDAKAFPDFNFKFESIN